MQFRYFAISRDQLTRLAGGLVGAIAFVTDMMYGGNVAVAVAAAAALLFVLPWFALPLYRRSKLD